jgi:hypothetical protein
MYQDFFAQPRGVKPKSKGKGKDSVKKDKKGKGKAKGVSFNDEDEEMGSDVEEEEEEEGGRDIMGRFKGDLFDSDDEGDGEEKSKSHRPIEPPNSLPQLHPDSQPCRHTRSSSSRWLSKLPSLSSRPWARKTGRCSERRPRERDPKTRCWRKTWTLNRWARSSRS